jgi:hypothetical protein
MGLQHLIDSPALDLPFRELVLVFLAVVYIFHTWLDFRQRKVGQQLLQQQITARSTTSPAFPRR